MTIEQRDRRDDEEDVGEEVDDLVDDPAGVGGEDAERRREQRREQRRRQRRGAASGARRATTCEKMSLPWSVVPKRWCHDGACRVAARLKSVGSATEISGAITATTTMKPTSIRPTRDFGFARSSESQPGIAAMLPRRGDGERDAGELERRAGAATSAGPHARVEDEVERGP